MLIKNEDLKNLTALISITLIVIIFSKEAFLNWCRIISLCTLYYK